MRPTEISWSQEKGEKERSIRGMATEIVPSGVGVVQSMIVNTR